MVWACPACTFENEDQLFSCEICSSQKYHDGDELDDGEYDHYNDEVDEIQWDVDDAQEFDPERVDQQLFFSVNVSRNMQLLGVFQAHPLAPIGYIKELVSQQTGIPPDQLRMIYNGRQLEDDMLCHECGLVAGCTINAVLRLGGDIGEFGLHLCAPGTTLLTTGGAASPAQVRRLVRLLKARQPHRSSLSSPLSPFSSLSSGHVFVADALPADICAKLVAHVDAAATATTAQSQGPGPVAGDFKLPVAGLESLRVLAGEASVARLEALFAGRVDTIVLRRVVAQADAQCINFHLDVSLRTMQVALNDDDAYAGGRLVFATESGLHVPSRPAGSATLHDNQVVHGVSPLSSGARYGLFFLKKFDVDGEHV